VLKLNIAFDNVGIVEKKRRRRSIIIFLKKRKIAKPVVDGILSHNRILFSLVLPTPQTRKTPHKNYVEV
jgi:hypothetical protein